MVPPSRSAASNRDATHRANVQTPPARKFSRKAATVLRAMPQRRPIHRAGAPPHISWCKKRAHRRASPHRELEQFLDARSERARGPREAAGPRARRNDPADPAPSSPRAGRDANLLLEIRRPSRRVPAGPRSDTACPINPARWPHRADAQAHRPKASSCGINPENCASLAAKFVLTRAHLAQFLERDAPEFTARKGEMIGNVGDRDAEVARQIVVARASLSAIVQVINLKESEMNLPAALLT